jgi:hypothetical protein
VNNFHSPARFLDNQPQAARGMLLHSGQSVRRLDEKVVAVPWTMLTG